MIKLPTLFLLGALAAASQASITFVSANVPQKGDENVLYTGEGTTDNAPLILGRTNQSRQLVRFSGAGENLIGTGGQAWITGTDGDITRLTITPPEGQIAFSSVILNVNPDLKGNATSTVDFTVTTANQALTYNDVRVGPGSNFFTFAAGDGDVITSLSLFSRVQLSDVRQVRVGLAPVPEPASIMGLALGGLALLRRRKRG